MSSAINPQSKPSKRGFWRSDSLLAILIILFVCCVLLEVGCWWLKRHNEERHKERVRSSQADLDRQLSSLKEFGHQNLELYETRGTDDLLRQIDGMQDIGYLYIRGTDISDAGMQFVARLPNLERLEITGRSPGITDHGLAYLKGHPNLKSLTIGSKLTDSGLMTLKELPALRSLTLGSGSPRRESLTDAGLEYLKALKELKYLKLYGGWASQAAVEELRRQLPKTTISADSPK